MEPSRFIIGGCLFLFAFVTPSDVVYYITCLMAVVEYLILASDFRHVHNQALIALGTLGAFGMIIFGAVLKYNPDEATALVLFVSVSDAVQYIVGNVYGKTKIVSAISPNKSLEGYLGVVPLIAAGSIIPVIGLERALIWAIGGVLGDLYVSMCKRSMNIKDTSNLLGSHGGVFDRIDGKLGAAVLYAVLGVF